MNSTNILTSCQQKFGCIDLTPRFNSLSWSDMKKNDMLAEVARPIGGEDLKLDLARSGRKRGLSLEETRLAGIIQIEFIRSPVAIHPLSPYLKLI